MNSVAQEPSSSADVHLSAKFLGAGRIGDNDKAILVCFDRRLTDDEFRRFCFWLGRTAALVSDNLTVAVGVQLTPTVPDDGASCASATDDGHTPGMNPNPEPDQ